MTGTKTLFFGIPRVKDEPNIPIETKIGDPMISVKSITNEFFKGISKNIDTIGIKNIIGRQVNIQHKIIFKNNISSIDVSEVRYVSRKPLLYSSLKKLLELNRVVKMTVIQTIPGIILFNKFLSGPINKGKIEIIKKKNIKGKNTLLRFLK